MAALVASVRFVGVGVGVGVGVRSARVGSGVACGARRSSATTPSVGLAPSSSLFIAPNAFALRSDHRYFFSCSPKLSPSPSPKPSPSSSSSSSPSPAPSSPPSSSSSSSSSSATSSSNSETQDKKLETPKKVDATYKKSTAGSSEASSDPFQHDETRPVPKRSGALSNIEANECRMENLTLNPHVQLYRLPNKDASELLEATNVKEIPFLNGCAQAFMAVSQAMATQDYDTLMELVDFSMFVDFRNKTDELTRLKGLKVHRMLLSLHQEPHVEVGLSAFKTEVVVSNVVHYSVDGEVVSEEVAELPSSLDSTLVPWVQRFRTLAGHAQAREGGLLPSSSSSSSSSSSPSSDVFEAKSSNSEENKDNDKNDNQTSRPSRSHRVLVFHLTFVNNHLKSEGWNMLRMEVHHDFPPIKPSASFE